MAWPPPLSARWTALALFIFALALHLFVATGGMIAGLDFKTLIVVDEIGAILLTPILFAMLLGIRLGDAFLLRSAHWSHYAVAGIAAVPLQIFGGSMQELTIEALPGSETLRELLEQALEPLLQTNGWQDLVMLLFGAVFLAAVCEEILFRGLLMQLLARGGRWRSALFISGLLFAVFHLDIIGLVPRTLMGVYFGLLVIRSGSIFPAMVAHGANNLLAFAAIPFADSSAESVGPTVTQATGIAVVSGLVFAALMVAYMRLSPTVDADALPATRPEREPQPEPADPPEPSDLIGPS